MGEGDGQRLIGAVELIRFLGAVFVSGHCLLIGGTDSPVLVVGEHQTPIFVAACVAWFLQSEKFLDISHHVLEGSLVLFVPRDIVAVELGVGDGLVVESAEEEVVVGAGVSDGEAAGLMVCSDQDQGVVRVFLLELDRLGDCVGEGDGVRDCGTRVICVAGPVDLSFFYHHEEAIRIVQDFDSLLHVVGKGPFACLAVLFIGECARVSECFGDDDGLVALLERRGVLLGEADGITGTLRDVDIDGARVGLMSGENRRSGRSRIGSERGRIVCLRASCDGEGQETERAWNRGIVQIGRGFYLVHDAIGVFPEEVGCATCG